MYRLVWLLIHLPTKETSMAKGQLRSNREARKPKKEKGAVEATPAFGSQVKSTGQGLSLGKKHK